MTPKERCFSYSSRKSRRFICHVKYHKSVHSSQASWYNPSLSVPPSLGYKDEMKTYTICVGSALTKQLEERDKWRLRGSATHTDGCKKTCKEEKGRHVFNK